jgi:predicted ATP-binding protein involved in virulence
MIENPYKYTGPLDPVEDKLVFINRQKQVDTVIKGIRSGEYWAVLGPRQIGKTTFLRQILTTYTDAVYIYFDFEISPKSEKEFYSWLMHEILEDLPSKPVKPVEMDDRPEIVLIDFLKSLKPEDGQKKVIFLFDEIELIPFIRSFLNLWRKVYHERYHDKNLQRYSVIITGSDDLVKLSDSRTSPFNIAKKLYLEDFSRSEAECLIDTPLRTLGIRIDNEAKENLIDQLSGHPQMLQHSLSNLVETAAEENRSIREKDVDTVIKTLLNENASIKILKKNLEENRQLKDLVRDIFNGVEIPFHLHQEYSLHGAGCIVEDENSRCALRNKVYTQFLKDLLGIRGLIDRESEPHYFDDEKKTLPFALKQLRIKNYYGIIDTGISNIPLDAQWIFLTGENAFGKTAVLQALTIGLFGERDGNTILTGDQPSCEIGVEFYARGKTLINNLEHDFKIPGFTQFKNFAVYGPSRLEIQAPDTKNVIKGKSSQTYSIFNTDGALLNIEYELVTGNLIKEESQREIARQVLLKLLPNVADIKIKEKKVLYYEKESGEEGKTYDPLPFEKLAAGHKSIVAMVGDIMIRLFNQQPEAKRTEDLGGFVIIDELDLHLHPKWLRQLPTLLYEVFPKVQFIVSTHSVIPFLGAPPKSAFLKVTRNNKKEGIRIERIHINVKNLLPNAILTSEIFDMDKITHTGIQNIDEIRTEDYYKKIVEIDEIRKKLKAFEESDMDFPDDLFEPQGKDKK